MNRIITQYNRHTHQFEASLDGHVIASGESYLAADAAKRSALIRLNVALILACPITPTPAPVKQKTPTGKKPRGQRKAPRPSCLCPKCMGWAGDLDAAVHRCGEMQAFCIYYAGEYRAAYETHLEATIELNRLKHPHLRQAVA